MLSLFTFQKAFRTSRFIILMLFLALYSTANSQVTGIRPPIDYSAIDSSAFEPGRFRVKFKPVMTPQLARGTFSFAPSVALQTGERKIDQLNQKYNVQSGRAMLSSLNMLKSTSSAQKAAQERHQKHGLDLWYEFECATSEDILQIINEYNALQEVEIAEPVFKIVLVGQPEPAFVVERTREIISKSTNENWNANDTRYAEQWHYNNTGQNNGTAGADIDLQRAWQLEKGNPEVIVAVIDEGIDFNHPDLAANMWHGVGLEGTATWPGNHGTHVAGTIAAVTNNSIGVAGIAGGDGNGNGVRLMSLDLFNGRHNLSTLEMNVWAADNGAAISQNSWGYVFPDVYNQSDLDGIDYFNTYGGGDVMTGGISIFAAGNDNNSRLWYPACYPGALSVAATNHRDQKAYYSNYASWVDISAPGGETVSSYSTGVLSTLNNNGYGFYQGTSMACPHVSGVAALILSNAPGILTATDLRNILLETADDHYGNNPTYTGMLGTGRLNAYNALEAVSELHSGVRNPASFNVTTLGENTINLEWLKNSNNNPVIIAWSESETFGTPLEGTAYNPGNTITGGGTVFYNGTLNNFNHDNLTINTLYYYKIWSYNEEHEYSRGIKKQAKTFRPLVSLSTDHLNFGTVYTGYSVTMNIMVENKGQSDLKVSNIEFSNFLFSSVAEPGSISPGETFNWAVQISTAEPVGLVSGTLSFRLNDPETPSASINLSATVSDLIPFIETSPKSYEEHLDSGDTATSLLTIKNTGTGNLSYGINIIFPEVPLTANKSIVKQKLPDNKLVIAKGSFSQIDYDDREITFSGGSLETGYKWSVTDNDLIDTSNGTSISLWDDDYRTNIPLGFNFNYFDEDFAEINIMSNGWVSFTNFNNWHPYCMPEVGGAIAPYALDLLPDNQTRISYLTLIHKNKKCFVVEYNNIRIYGTSTRLTFQIVFFERSNIIKFQYQKVTGRPAAIGIESRTGDIGIGNCGTGDAFINPNILTDNLAIEFKPLRSGNWLNLSETQGNLLPDANKDITLEISAKYLNEGIYTANLEITSNDPSAPQVTIPVALHVTGKASMIVEPDIIEFGQVFIGYHLEKSFQITNTGTAILVISDIAVNNGVFSVDLDDNTISIGETRNIEVKFSPLTNSSTNGILTIHTNDPENPEVELYLYGSGVIPPSISIKPVEITASLISGEQTQRTIILTNDTEESVDLKADINITAISKTVLDASSPALLSGEPSASPSITGKSADVENTNPTFAESNTDTPHNSGFSVLYLNSLQNYDSDFKQLVGSLPNVRSFHELSIYSNTPNTEYLLSYDIVVISSSFAILNPVALGDALAEYVDQGGRLCMLQATHFDGGGWTLQGRIMTEEFSPMASAFYDVNEGIVTGFADHPITKSVALINTLLYSHSEIQGNGLSLGKYNIGHHFAAVNQEKPVVVLNIYPENGMWGGDLATLMSNTFEWLMNSSGWLKTDKRSVTIPAGQSIEIQSLINANNLYEGTYNSSIQILSNSPDKPVAEIPVTLNVTGVPAISVDLPKLDFDGVFINDQKRLTFIITNSGNADLDITELKSDNPAFLVEPVSESINQKTKLEVEVLFTPSAKEVYNGTITIHSNDPFTPSFSLDLTGNGIIPPTISLDQESFEEYLYSGFSTEKKLTISNTSTQSINLDVIFEVEYKRPDPLSPNLITGMPKQGPSYSGNGSDVDIIEDGNPFTSSGILNESGLSVLYLNSMGGLDYNFTQMVKSFPNVSIFDKINTVIATPDSDYLLAYDLVIVASNSQMLNPHMLGDALAEYVDKGGLVCLMQGTLSQGGNWALQGRIVTPEYSPLSVSTYTAMPIVGSDFIKHPITRGVTSLGTDIYSLSAIQGNGISLGQFTNGYSCAAINDEKGIVSLNIFPGDGSWNGELGTLLSNAFDYLMLGRNWLSFNPISASIPAGESVEVQITFDAEKLSEGTFEASVKLNNNSLISSLVEIPAILHVTNAPKLSVEFDTIKFENTIIGVGSTIPLTIKNDGKAKLNINGTSISNQAFILDSDPETIEVGKTGELLIRFNPVYKTHYYGELTINSNDPVKATTIVQLMGSALVAPQVTVSPPFMEEQLQTGEILERKLFIKNEGNDCIDLQVTMHLSKDLDAISGTQLLTSSETQVVPKPNILYINTFDGYDSRFKNQVKNLSGIASFIEFDARWATPDVEFLKGFDVVIVAAYTPFSNAELLGNNLADYADNKGTLILMAASHFYTGNELGGRIALPEYQPLNYGQALYTYGYCNLFSEHAITQNLEYIYTYTHYSCEVEQGAITLGRYNGNSLFGAINVQKGVIALNISPYNYSWSGDLDVLTENIINWSYDLVSWVETELETVTIPAGETLEIPVTFNAHGRLKSNTYYAKIDISSNDPVSPEITVALKLHVTNSTNSLKTEKQPEYRVFPNPAREKVNLTLPEPDNIRTVELKDPTGRSIYSINSNSGSYNFDIQNLPSGLYFIEITYESFHFAVKFIKE
jgi:subtilisin family serine protease